MQVVWSFCAVILLAVSTVSTAEELSDNASNVFRFQQKLAAKGNVQAMYQLGFMSEVGEGVKQDIQQAQQWYKKAADKGNKAAADRLIYLEIRQTGYKKNEHGPWLKQIKSEADISHQETLFLLGQMYHYGVGVRKDLGKSLEIMYQLGLEGMTAADGEIRKIQAEIVAAKRAREKRQQAQATKQNKPAITQKTTQAATKKTGNPVVKQTTTKDDDKEARRKRYEAIMKKLAEEQAEINRLQGQVEGKGEAEVDDEI